MAKHGKNIFNDKRFFYIALAVCMLALGSASASAFKSYKTVQEGQTVSEPEISNTEAKEANEPLSNVPYSRDDTENNEADGTGGQQSEQQKEKNTEASNPAAQEGTESDQGEQKQSKYFILPVGGKILKDFDDCNLQYSETYKDWRLHLALDIAANKGTAVFSAAGGTVLDVYEDDLFGTVVKIDHYDGLIAYYCGLNSAPSVKKGQQVDGGYQIGAIDELPCESVEETHIHLIMEQDGVPVSPLKVMEMKE